jgi:hypothetical protein
MVYNTRDYQAFGLSPSSGILKTQKNTTFRKLDLFPSSGEGVGNTYSVGAVRLLRLGVSNGPKRVGVSHPSPEGGNRYSFRNIMFLEYGTMDKDQKPSNPECHNRSATQAILSPLCGIRRFVAVFTRPHFLSITCST